MGVRTLHRLCLFGGHGSTKTDTRTLGPHLFGPGFMWLRRAGRCCSTLHSSRSKRRAKWHRSRPCCVLGVLSAPIFCSDVRIGGVLTQAAQRQQTPGAKLLQPLRSAAPPAPPAAALPQQSLQSSISAMPLDAAALLLSAVYNKLSPIAACRFVSPLLHMF